MKRMRGIKFAENRNRFTQQDSPDQKNIKLYYKDIYY